MKPLVASGNLYEACKSEKLYCFVLFFSWKQNTIPNKTILPDKYWRSHCHIHKSRVFIQGLFKKKTRFILKYLCHDFGPRRQVLSQDLPSQIDYPPPTRSTNEPRNKRTYTVLQHKQDVLKPRQVAQKAFIHVGLCVSSRNKCVIGLRDHSWKILGPEPRLVLKAITTAAAPQHTPGG